MSSGGIIHPPADIRGTDSLRVFENVYTLPRRCAVSNIFFVQSCNAYLANFMAIQSQDQI